MKAARIPDWAWVLLFAGGVLALAAWLEREAGGAPPFGPEPVPR